MFIKIFFFLSLLVSLILPSAAFSQGAWKALIIGIGDYQDRRVTDLRTPVADGQELARILAEGYGFEIVTLFDREATWNNIDTALRKLISDTTEDDSVLIYYGGHGDLDEKLGEGWWYPADAVPGKRQTYLQNSDLRELIKRMPAKHVLLVSDSCFAGSLFGDYRSFSAKIDDRYHQRLYKSKSRQGLTSGGREPVLDGGSSEHSIFAYHLLKFLRTTDQDIFSVGELFTQIAPVVTNNSIQKPECLPILFTGHEQGEFVFVRSGAEIRVAVSPAVSGLTVARAEKSRKLLWIGTGLVLCLGLVFTLFLVPRIFLRKREKVLSQLIISRNGAEVARLIGMDSCKNEELLARAQDIIKPAAGLLLEGVKERIFIAPGPRQGVGRSSRWPLTIADPHISRKPHCWLLMNEDSFSINSDGGEIVINGESCTTAPLVQGDSIELGPVTVLQVERAVHSKGIVLLITAGPDRGGRLVMLSDFTPLHWITRQHQAVGKLSWQQEHPRIVVTAGDTHPMPNKNAGAEFSLISGDVLRIGELDWMVTLL